MSGNNLITVDALDFGEIKSRIRTFLSGQSVFADYNFEGSALSTLVDLLAYNTHYNALYTNMALNEQFLDSASKYSSVVSLAKQIGYTAKQVKSANAKISITVSGLAVNPPTLSIPRGTTFTSKAGVSEFRFSTRQAYTAELTGSSYIFNDVMIYEGSRITNEYLFNENTKFIIPSRTVDLSSLSVRVFDSSQTSEFNNFIPVDNLLTIDGFDRIYFVKQNEDLFYEVYFGNDVLGKAIVPGNVVSLDYAVSSGDVANGGGQFFYTSGFISNALIRVQTIARAAGGAPAESLEQIKFNAPRMYSAQNRAVTATDYKTQLQSNFPQIETVQVWGGQDNVPRQFGKVFISAKPFNREELSQLEQDDIRSFLKLKRSVLTVTHEFVKPKLIDILISTSVYYDIDKTTRTQGDIAALVRGQITQLSSQLNKFGVDFRYSNLVKLIDSSERQIVSNITNIALRYKEIPIINRTETYKLDIKNPIKQQAGSFYTTKFFTDASTLPCHIEDDGLGQLILYQNNTNGPKQALYTIGSINYLTGSIDIRSLNIISLSDTRSNFYYYITPSSNDVIPVNQYILQIPDLEVKITAIPERSSNQVIVNHTFSPSR